jgi:hypothetical protein
VDYGRRDTATQAAMRDYHEAALEVDEFSRDYLAAHMKNRRVVENPGTGCSVYITHGVRELGPIRTFLADVRRP